MKIRRIQSRIFPLFLATAFVSSSFANDIASDFEKIPDFISKGPRIRAEIQSLKLDSSSLEISLDDVADSGGGETPRAKINGVFAEKNGTLLLEGNARILLDENGRFTLKVPLTTEKTPIRIVAIDSFGRMTVSSFLVTYRKTSSSEITPSLKRTSISAGIGVTSLRFSDPRMPDPYTSTAVTLKAALSRALSRRWETGVSGYLTALHLSQASPDDARFYGLNLRLGYLVTPPTADWRFVIHGGFYYTTMSVPTNRFGYQNIGGPQIFPTVRRLLENGNAISVYGKLSPVSSSFRLLDLSSREVAMGTAFYFGQGALKDWSIAFDASHVQVDLEGLRVSSRSFTLGVTRSF